MKAAIYCRVSTGDREREAAIHGAEFARETKRGEASLVKSPLFPLFKGRGIKRGGLPNKKLYYLLGLLCR